jgi:hypothetical protein
MTLQHFGIFLTLGWLIGWVFGVAIMARLTSKRGGK